MSVRWISRVWEDSPYEGRRLLLHLALADFANDEGTCFPSQKTLALKARTTEAWVSISIKVMIEDGFLEILTKGSGRGNRTVYLLKKGATQKGVTELSESEKGESELEKNLNVDDSLTNTKNRQEPSLDLMQSFDKFWKKYPRKVAKVAARNVFVKVMKKSDAPSLEVLLTAVEKYSASELDMRYVAHPATWLRQGRWEDEQEVTETPKPAIKDWHLDNALDRVYPLARMGKSWDECLDSLRDFEPRVIEPCKKVFEDIRATK
jgi:hypothetical protein